MNIELSNICNHSCNFCPSSKITRKRCFIDNALVFRLLEEAYNLGVREVSWHILGEPFLNKHLAEFIRYAKRLGYAYIYMTTNGSLASPERLDEVFEAGLDSIKFSINAGTRESYALIHGRDDFDGVIASLRYCNEYRKKNGKNINIFVSYIVTNQSMREAKKFKQEYLPFVDDIAFYNVLNRGGLMPENMNLSAYGPKHSICTQPFNTIFVTCEGYLSPCCMDSDLNLVVADLHKTTLHDAWYSEKMTEFRKRHLKRNFKGIQCETCLACGSNKITVLDL